MFLQGVGMVYFHFPFSTHAPVPVCQRAWWFELNLQELGPQFAAANVVDQGKIYLESSLDIYPIMSYLLHN